MRYALVHRQLQHLRIDHDQPHLFRLRLVENTENHGVDADRLARPGSACNQEVRHARKIGYHGIAADILAQGERQWRRHVIVRTRLEDFAQRNELAVLVRNFEPHERLSRDNLYDTHADDRQ